MSVWLALAALATAGSDGNLGGATRVRIHLTCSATAEQCEAMYAALGQSTPRRETRHITVDEPRKLGLVERDCRVDADRRVCDGV
jgi:hypothetical protein